MSTPGRAAARRAARAGAKHDQAVGRRTMHDQGVIVSLAWCRHAEDVAGAQERTRATLLAEAAGLVSSAVWWQIEAGNDAAAALIRLKEGCTDPTMLDYYTQIARLLAEDGGFLVAALAEGDTTIGG